MLMVVYVNRPAAIGVPNGCEAEYEMIQQRLAVPEFPPQSDTECLNLTVTVPESPGRKKLPVFVFIHGGGLTTGSGTWPQYDHAAIVRRSVELGKPIIGVNINYRTGIYGFLTSEELRTAGFTANNGLRGQNVAFQWIKKFISGFDGDPGQITAVGQSAGGACATLLLQSPKPLFNRMVVMSGTSLALRPEPMSLHELFYEQFCEIHGLADISGAQRVEALNKIDSHELLQKTPPSIPSLPALDNDFSSHHIHVLQRQRLA
ncbi:Alpha/Beta hydrolase protein [Coniochaeta sp. 2T2.1]|nr:Alpha/Beta hydrolase protein [Coniochaeta sp. 2T2.1]